MMKEVNRKKLATLSLMMATLFLPFGYDVVFAMIQSWTNSYWTTTFIFYCLSGLFFGVYFFLSKINPIKLFIPKFKSLIKKIRQD